MTSFMYQSHLATGDLTKSSVKLVVNLLDLGLPEEAEMFSKALPRRSSINGFNKVKFMSNLMMDTWKTWSLEELERQMSPSRWNPSKTPDDVIGQYIAKSSEATQRARKVVPHELDISYGSLQCQKYDMYGTDLPDEATIFLWIHGGYWQEGSKNISGAMAENLYKIGIKTAVLGYTLAPAASLQQIEEEFNSALCQVLQQSHKAKIFVGGHSAGAQLAASLLHNKNDGGNLKGRLAGLILVSGVYDLRPVVPTYVNDALKLSGTAAETFSPLLQPFNSNFAPETLRISLCIGGMDSPEYKRQCGDYHSKLQSRYQNVTTRVFETEDHFTLVERLCDISESAPGHWLRQALSQT